MHRSVAWSLVLALVLPASGALAQGGTGPNLEVTVEPLGELLEPGDEGIGTTVTVRASCESVSGSSRTVDLSAQELPKWVDVSFDPATVVLTSEGCPERGNVTATSTLQVAATRSAPAFQEKELRVVAVSDNGARDTKLVEVEADYFNEVVIHPTGVTEADPGEVVEVDVTIENRGNAPTTVYVQRVDVPHDAKVALPTAQTVASLQQGASSNTLDMTFLVTAPQDLGWTDRTDPFRFEARSWLAWDRTVEGPTQQFSFDVHTDGVHVPGPAIAVLVVVLAGLAVAPFAKRYLDEREGEEGV